MNQLPIEIPLDYDAKRTRNRLAQRRRREKQKLENAADKEPTPPQSRPESSCEIVRQQRSTGEMAAWEQSRDAVQLTSPVSLHSWGPANNASAVMSPWLESQSTIPSASTATSPAQAQGGEVQHPDDAAAAAASFFLNADVMFQPETALLIDPLLRPITHPVLPSPRRCSTGHSGQAAIAGVSSSTHAAAHMQSQDHGPWDPAQAQAVLSPSAFHRGGGAAVKRHSIAASSISSLSSIGSTGPSSPPSSSSSSMSILAPSSAAAVSSMTRPRPPVPDVTAERSIATILTMADEMGFESFDDLAATYYTATFSEGSLPRYAQSASRSRRLCGLLTELHVSSREWVGREARGYHDAQTRLLETICVEELGGRGGDGGSNEEETQTQPQPQRSIHHTQAFITNMIRQLFTEDGAEKRLGRDKQLLQEQVRPQTHHAPCVRALYTLLHVHGQPNGMPSLWSLLSRIAQQTNSRAEDTALAICVFVYLLQVPL
ncbi:hypothetical protein E4U55_006273 [Claviceps digitariae]|nr:hypothetical protein E4U55_006273 [Claviceps digitariae]